MVVIDKEVVAQGTGCEAETTNNRMELTAALRGLEWVKLSLKPEWMVELVSDSQYTLGIANGAWRASSNLDLVEALRKIYCEVGVWRTRWVPGHTGDTYNEMCDRLAGEEKEICVNLLKSNALRAKQEESLLLDNQGSLPGDPLV